MFILKRVGIIFIIILSIQDVAKPSLRKDWNCPWVKRDGKGLKRVVRNIYGEDPAPAPAATSHHHFYRQRHYYNPNCNILTLFIVIVNDKLFDCFLFF